MNISKIALSFSIGLLFSLNQVQAQDKFVKIDSLMHRANNLGIFNGNILVADHGQVIYKASFGFTDATGKVLLTDQYRFNIGSIAKEFNAVAIMMLKEQGKLELTDKISKYLPYLPAWANQISIQNLLQYTSGLPDVKWATVHNDADNMADLKKIEKLDFEPGTNYAYNNNNVFLQRRIIESISGLTFKQFVEQKILKPSGMKEAIIDPSEQDSFIARAYDNSHKQDDLSIPISGWTSVTLANFYKWSKVINNFSLISPASTRAILIPGVPNKQAGLGGGAMDGDKVLRHVHDGTTRNYQALLVSSVPQHRDVILMTNNKNVSLYDFNTAIQAILDDKPYIQPRRAFINTYQKQLDSLSGTEIVKLYKTLKIEKPNEYSFDSESTLNTVGYYLLGKKRNADAIAVFEYNTTLFPASGNVFDSLGEAYYKQGDKVNALLNYKRSVQLDPENKNGKDIILELQK